MIDVQIWKGIAIRSSDVIGDRGKFVFLAGRNSKINDDIVELDDEVGID